MLEILLVNSKVESVNACGRGSEIFSERFINTLKLRHPSISMYDNDLRQDKNAIALFKELGPKMSSGAKGQLFIETIPDVFVPYMTNIGTDDSPIFPLWGDHDPRGDLFIISGEKEKIKIRYANIYSNAIAAEQDADAVRFQQIFRELHSLEDRFATDW